MANYFAEATRMTERIYRYVVRVDAASAPNPFGGWCSLAICKPHIRQYARVGDWIVGLRSRMQDQVIYVMQVEECMQLADYWFDPRFQHKKPDACPRPDNIYRPDRSSGHLEQVANCVHDRNSIARDLSVDRVLVGRQYWYFGSSSPSLSTDLVHLVYSHIGQTYAGTRPGDVGRLVELARASGSIGVNGVPIDAILKIAAMKASSKQKDHDNSCARSCSGPTSKRRPKARC